MLGGGPNSKGFTLALPAIARRISLESRRLASLWLGENVFSVGFGRIGTACVPLQWSNDYGVLVVAGFAA